MGNKYTTKYFLKKTREVFENYGWTQGAFARISTTAKRDVNPINSDASCFCLSGAMMRAHNQIFIESKLQLDEVNKLHNLANKKINKHLRTKYNYGLGIENWNDAKERRKSHIMKLLDEVIAA